MKPCGVAIQMELLCQYFHVVLLVLCILQNVNLKFLVCFGANLVTTYL